MPKYENNNKKSLSAAHGMNNFVLSKKAVY